MFRLFVGRGKKPGIPEEQYLETAKSSGLTFSAPYSTVSENGTAVWIRDACSNDPLVIWNADRPPAIDRSGGFDVGCAIAWNRHGFVVSTDDFGFAGCYRDETSGDIFTDPCCYYRDLINRINVESWAGYLLVGYCLGSLTHFPKASLMPAGTDITYHADGRVTLNKRELELGRQSDDVKRTAENIILGMRKILESPIDDKSQLVLPLSAGLDSRFLAALMSKLDLDLQTLTTDIDFGYSEKRVAALVAGSLRLPNRYVQLPTDYVQSFQKECSRLCNFEASMHTWLIPLVNELPVNSLVVDGAGGFMLKSDFVNVEDAARCFKSGLDNAKEFVFECLVYNDTVEQVFRKSILDILKAIVKDEIERELTTIECHPDNVKMYYFWLRNRYARAILKAPFNIIGSRAGVALPYLQKSIIVEALALDPLKKKDFRLFKTIFNSFPAIADLPSTKDPDFKKKEIFAPSSPAYQWSPDTLLFQVDQLRRHRDVLNTLCTEDFVQIIMESRIDEIIRERKILRLLRRLFEFTLWIDEFCPGKEGLEDFCN